MLSLFDANIERRWTKCDGFKNFEGFQDEPKCFEQNSTKFNDFEIEKLYESQILMT